MIDEKAIRPKIATSLIRKTSTDTSKYIGEAASYARESKLYDSKEKANKKRVEAGETIVETSIETQTTANLKLAEQKGYHVAETAVYKERFTGAELFDRPLLTELRAEIRAGKYKALFVYATDRLARDPIHLAIIAQDCERFGCELIFVTEPMDNTPEAGLIRYVKGYAAQIEREKIRERVMRAKSALINSGRMVCTGLAKFGYRYDSENHKRVIDVQAADIVRRMFEWVCHDGLSANAVARRLNELGISTPAEMSGVVFKADRDKLKWSTGTVTRILNDESYTGKTYVGRWKRSNERAKKGLMKMKPTDKSEWLALPEGVTPQIIEPEVFAAVQRRLAANRKNADNTRNHLRPRLLRGLIFCAECGSRMYPQYENGSKHRTRKDYVPVYRCSARRLKNGVRCGGGRVNAIRIEAAVWSFVAQELAKPELFESRIREALQETPEDEALRSDLEGAQQELEKAQRMRDKLYRKWLEAEEAGEDEEMVAKYESDHKEYGSHAKALKLYIDEISARLNTKQKAAQAIERFQEHVSRAVKGLKGEMTFAEKVAALQSLRVRVEAHSQRKTKIALMTGVLSPIIR